MRVLLAAFGTRGDVQPMVALGMRLRADGHQVVLGASSGFATWVRGHGLEFHTIGGDIEAWIRGNGAALVKSPARLLKPALDYLREEVDVSFQQTYAAARRSDLIVSGVHAAAPSVAEALGVPHRTLLFCPQLVPSRLHPPMGVPWLSLPRFLNRLLWLGCGRSLDLALGPPIQRWRRRWGLPPITDVTSHLYADPAIVASDAVLGDLPPDAPSGVVQVGSLALDEGGALDPRIERFLAEGAPPIYIGFGSMSDGDPQHTTRVLVEALEACGRRGIILAGWADLGGGTVPSKVLVVPSVPHPRLFPRVALAVHHGGAGTTAAAARAGIPQIVVPHIADQFYWGHQVHARGLGSRAIPRTALTAAKLARAIEDVLSRPEIAENARDVKARLDRADGVSELTRLLRQVVPLEAERRPAA